VPRFIHFTDKDGRRWRVYEFSVLAGRIVYGALGRRGSQCAKILLRDVVLLQWACSA
jgi:hypothetical protein